MKILRMAFLVGLLASTGLAQAYGGGIDGNAVLGGGLGGAAGAAVGSAMGGRDGAMIGGALGAVTGVYVASGPARYEPAPRYYYERRGYVDRDDRGWHRGWRHHHREHWDD